MLTITMPKLIKGKTKTFTLSEKVFKVLKKEFLFQILFELHMFP